MPFRKCEATICVAVTEAQGFFLIFLFHFEFFLLQIQLMRAFEEEIKLICGKF